MIYCSNCGAEIKEGELFCSECGFKIEQTVKETEASGVGEPVFCPECGAKNSTSDLFCQECGAKLAEGESGTAENAETSVDAGAERVMLADHKKKMRKTLLTGGAAAIVIIAAAALILPNMGKGSSSQKDTGIVYAKDNSLYHYDGRKMIELTDRLAENEDSGTNYGGFYVRYSEDGRYAFYLERFRDDNTGTLYCMDLKKQSEKKDTAKKISGNVEQFSVSPGNRVFYLKKSDDGNALYMTDLKEETTLDTDVYNFRISKDGQKVLWINDEDVMYYSDLKSGVEKEKLDSNVSLLSATDDLDTVYYSDDEDTLYCLKSFEKTKIASEADYIDSTDSGRKIYYTVKNGTFDQAKYLEDDMASQDAVLTEPNVNNYKKVTQNVWGIYYTTDNDAYRRDMNAYEGKLKRDALRQELKNPELSNGITLYDVYLCDGTDSALLAEGMMLPEHVAAYTQKDEDSKDSVYIAYSTDGVDFPHIRLSELSDAYEFRSEFYDALYDAAEDGLPAKLLVDGRALDITYHMNNMYRADLKNGILYCGLNTNRSDSSEESGNTSLLRIKYTPAGIEEPELLDDEWNDIPERNDGSYSDMTAVVGEELYYVKDYDFEGREGTLYCRGAEIADDVYDIHAEKDRFFIHSGYSDRNGTYTLSEYRNGKVETAAEDVYSYEVMADGKIMLLTDYSSRRQTGDLYVLHKGKKELVDEDVKYITK